MNPKAVYKYCKHLGCCEACCLRYIGIKNPNAYENVSSFVIKYQDDVDTKPISANEQNQTNATNNTKEITLDVSRNDNENINGNSLDLDNKGVNNSDSPACKKRKLDVCVSCLGILQEDNWTESYVLVKGVLFKKRYECKTFACALSAPIATLLRERAITLRLAEELPGYDDKTLTALKEAWKWSFGVRLAAEIDKILDSGAVSPLLITLNYDYADDLQELEILKQVSPQLFEERSKQKRRFVTEFTRRSVEQALENASVQSLRAAGGGLPGVAVRAMCIGAVCTHAPTYLAGRYIKLSRNLPQSPWILDGKRVLPSSVQEIIYKPLADFYNLEAEEADRRLKLIAAGREDVDARCLGDGRPFAIEITDPTRPLSSEELSKACEEISKSGEVIVKKIVPITKEDLVQLKKGEETKSKTYEALCIKLSHSKYDDIPPDSPIKVTPEDIDRINSFSNSPQNPKPSENIQKNSNHTLNTTKSSQDASGPTCKTPEDLKDKVDSVESTKSVLISESIDNDKNIPMDTSGDIVDTSNGVKKAEKVDNLEDIKDTEMKISINIREDESRDSKNTNADILDKSNGDQKSEKLENSEDNRNIVMETSGNTDVKDPSEDNLMDTFNGFQKTRTLDNTVHSKDPGDRLDTSKELTESVIQDGPEDAKITIQQKTPIRVLHRRPLLTRTRQILELNAIAVPEHPQLFRIRVRTSAGTYVKEWAHGELGRTSPALGDALGAAVDMLALDVTAVHLAWPPRQ